MKIPKATPFVLLVCVLFASCSVVDVSNEGPIRKGTVITLQEPYYFIDNPGDDRLVAVKNFTELASYSKSKTLLPKGTRIEYLKTNREEALMAPMPRTTNYGRVLGMNGMRKVNIDSLVEAEFENRRERLIKGQRLIKGRLIKGRRLIKGQSFY
jgi:hypothetical protein